MNPKPLIMFAALLGMAFRCLASSGYAVVVSAATKAGSGWNSVVTALCEKHGGAAELVFTNDVKEILPALNAQMPKYTCFVATPAEASREFVKKVHQITRGLNGDSYPGTFWGILTGYDAANALRIARQNEPLTVHRVLASTPIALDRCEEGVWYSELEAGRIERKNPGKDAVGDTGPADSTSEIVAGLNDFAADLFITSGHASEHDWMLGYTYRNGFFKCANGQIYGADMSGNRLFVTNAHPRVYLPVGNCLIGHVDGSNCMAIAYMNSAGVTQMIGYTVPSWYGYAGWGMLDYFYEQPGRFTMAEAFRANQIALANRLSSEGLNAGDKRGLEYDRDVVAFYGDPAWSAKMAPGRLNWDQKLACDGDKFTFEVLPRAGLDTFKPVNTNGSQRGGRPIVQFLPRRVKAVKILEGGEWKPVIADDFVLVPNPGSGDKPIRVVFQALEI